LSCFDLIPVCPGFVVISSSFSSSVLPSNSAPVSPLNSSPSGSSVTFDEEL